MNEWKEYKFKDFANFSQGIQVDIENQFNESFKGCIRFLRIVDFTKGSENEIRYIKNPGEKYLVDSDDLVMLRYGSQTAGKIARGYSGAIANNTFKITLNKFFADKNFIFYFLSQQSIYHFFHNSQSSSTMPAITFSMMSDLDILLPPLPEQKAIAEVLSSLDDKIDLLHRQNETLEKMAETLFRQWFIEEAKDDWEEVTFSNLIEETIGGEWGKENPENEYIIPVLCFRGTDIADLNSGLPSKIPLRYVKEKKYNLIKPREGDILLEISGGTENQSTGRVTYINSDIENLFKYPIVFSNFCRLIRIKNNEYSFFLYLYLKFLYDQDEFFNLENGSSGIKNLNYKALINELKYRIPETEIIKDFHNKVERYFKKIIKNKLQIQTLTKLRDTLLPKLMSGEVRVNYN